MPQLKVEIAWGAGFSTPIADRVYTDVSQWVEGALPLDITYGRADELAVADAGSCTLTLDNSDGRFTPGKSSSPYFPNVKKGKPIRVSVVYPSGTYVRFTGYVDAWPVVWPDGSSAVSTVTITCSTRRARLGKTAPLTASPIRYAYYLPDTPQAYWPMDYVYPTTVGTEVFLDATNMGESNQVTENRLGVYTSTAALQPSFDTKRREGPVDENVENGMLYFPSFTNIALLGQRPHYVGSGGACKINTAGELTIEMVARIGMGTDELGLVNLAQIQGGIQQMFTIDVANFGGGVYAGVSCGIYLYTDTGSVIDYEDSADVYNPDAWAIATDGEIHHYAFTLTGGVTGTLYLDGTMVGTVTFPVPFAFDDPFASIVLGGNTYNSELWLGHVAVRDEALSVPEIQAHADAATTQDETSEERLQRVFGYMGVPAAEVSAEVSVALPVGDQTQIDRASIEIADELASSTGGILYDDRNGNLVLQARNHRYNQTAAFSLSATGQEFEADLTPILDDQRLVNYVTVTRSGVDDLSYFWKQPSSIDAYGTYSQSLEVVTTSWEEARSAALAAVVRYSEPQVRVSNISVDILNSAQRDALLTADISTLFNIKDLPPQAPTDPMPLFLEGYSESITATSHTLSMNTTPGDLYSNVLVLDDPVRGVLGANNVLAY